MELYNWKNLNHKLTCLSTKKKFFNKYFYSIKYYCPGGRIIMNPGNNNIDNITAAVELRKTYELRFQSRLFFPWNSEFTSPTNDEKVLPQQLLDITLLKNSCKDIKIRVQEPFVTIYSESEELLFKIANNELCFWSNRLEIVSKPETDNIKNLLKDDVILIAKDVGFKYKFICKDGVYQNKAALYTYLDQLGNEIKISKTNWTYLESVHRRYIRSFCIYSNDLNIANMLNIIEVNAVKNIHELVIKPTK